MSTDTYDTSYTMYCSGLGGGVNLGIQCPELLITTQIPYSFQSFNSSIRKEHSE